MDRLYVVLCGTKFKAHSRSLEVFGDYCCLDFFVRARGDSNEREREREGMPQTFFPQKSRHLNSAYSNVLTLPLFASQSRAVSFRLLSQVSLSLSRFFLILRPSLVLWLFHVVAVSFSNTV